MTEYNSPQSDPDPDVQPQDQSPDDFIVIQLPAWEMRMPGAPIPNEDEDRPADKRDYFDDPFNKRFTRTVHPLNGFPAPVRRRSEPLRPW